jgi:capsular polysaccharide export protein
MRGAGALITYPIYVMPNGWPCEAETLIEAWCGSASAPLPAPARPDQQMVAGMLASLDRTPPPAY